MSEYPRELPPEEGQSVEDADANDRGTPLADVAAEVLRRMEESVEQAATARRGVEGQDLPKEKSRWREVGAAVLAGGGEMLLKNLGEFGASSERSRH